MTLLSCYSNGYWHEIEAGKEKAYIKKIIERESWLAPRLGREPMTTEEQVIEYLKNGNELKWDDEWYAKIKMVLPKKPSTHVEMVKCDCGHTIPKCSVMSTSTGTSCPECYDKMSM